MATSSPVKYRNRPGVILVWFIWTVGTLIALARLIEALERDDQLAIPILWGILLFVFAVPMVRSLRWGVIAGPTDVIVRNILRTHKVQLSEVDRCEIDRLDPWPRVGIVILQSGKRIPMTALQDGLAVHVAQRAVDDLNQRLATERHGAGATDRATG